MKIDDEIYEAARERLRQATQFLSPAQRWELLGEWQEEFESGMRERAITSLAHQYLATELLAPIGNFDQVRKHKWWKAFMAMGKPIEARLHTLRLNIETLPRKQEGPES